MSRVSADKGLAKGCLVPRIQSSADLSKANENLVLTHEATIEYSSFRLFANIDDSCLKNNGHLGAIRPKWCKSGIFYGINPVVVGSLLLRAL